MLGHSIKNRWGARRPVCDFVRIAEIQFVLLMIVDVDQLGLNNSQPRLHP